MALRASFDIARVLTDRQAILPLLPTRVPGERRARSLMRGRPLRRVLRTRPGFESLLVGGALVFVSACAGRTASPLSAAQRSDEVVFIGMCDASGAVPLSAHSFAVADDEDNVLRVYDADRGGPPLYERDISAGIGIPARPSKRHGAAPKPPPEADIEAATRYGEIALWLSSHARNSKGKRKPERLRFFATSLPTDGAELRVIGDAYSDLIADLAADPRYAPFDLRAAAERAPKTRDGLNIEGMTTRARGGVLIGLRAPVPGGRALLFALENPERVVQGERPRFGDPIQLDLGGRGIRGLSRWHNRYLILAGDWGEDERTQLFSWDGSSTQAEPLAIDLSDLNPEGFFTPEERDTIMVLSDDGSRPNQTQRCKDQKDPTQKHFRGRWLHLP